ncbi:MAG: hypothetical protein R3C19_11785 [Planctomycetaceae bacterium]
MYAITIFLSAFLLFQVQPLLAKYILPWFGGTPAVWSTCMLFFQAMLLLGYAYAHGLVRMSSRRRQVIVHLCVLAATLALLPVMPGDDWKPNAAQDPASSNPTWQILALLLACVGGPYFVLSGTAPLLQSWFTDVAPGRSPFRLYAVSNAGALLALLTYPIAVEPFLTSRHQVYGWSAVYVVFVVGCAYCGIRLYRVRHSPVISNAALPDESSAVPGDGTAADEANWPYWVMLPACASVMLLATTNYMCQDVASVPFLWIVPLSLYLLSFIICFDHERWYLRRVFSVLLLLIIPLGLTVVSIDSIRTAWRDSIEWQVAALSAGLFICCMCSHGELVRLKPRTSGLTAFYLMIAFGGVLGGVFVTLAAPRIFRQYDEYIVGLMATVLLQLALLRRSRIRRKSGLPQGHRAALIVVAGIVTLVLVLPLFSEHFPMSNRSVVARGRNFYGALRVARAVRRSDGPVFVSLTHGTTSHGYQLQSDELRSMPTSYYVENSGIGIALRHHPGRDVRPLNIGVVGLGTGTLAAYGRSGDTMTFYEINPLILQYADQYFTFLGDARNRGVDVSLLHGDARIVMESQYRTGQVPGFDVLAIDAFASDSIPVHLLTRECFELYWQLLREDGILAVHISNRHLDLQPVVRKSAEFAVKEVCRVDHSPPDSELYASASVWLLVTSNQEFLADPDVTSSVSPWESADREPLLWTDDFNNLFRILR